MKERRITNILLLALLVFNVGFVGSWWYGHMKAHRMMKEHDMFAMHESKGNMYMVKELGLSDEQQAKLEILRKDHFQKVSMLEAAVGRNEKNIMGALAKAPVDSAFANKCADSVGIMKAAIQKELFAHFNNIRKMCTPEQSTKFDGLIEEMSKEFPHHFDGHHGSGEMHHDSM
jgi:protein CpxP